MVKKKFDVDLLFETSWEVCNKIGGIYTVLSTKAKTIQNLYKDKIVFIGPDVWSEETPSPYFKEVKTPLDKWKKQTSLPAGISVRTGRWDIPGKPMVILVDFKSMYALNDSLYGRMWELYGVDSLHNYGDYGEAAAFSHAAALVIEDICAFVNDEKKNIIAHFNEWTTGMALLHVKATLPDVATVFTTHATSIGRSICGNGKPLYDYMKGYNGDQMASELNMVAKHSLEKAAALNADCFTTVSEVTARECEQLLGRRPDVVTPNGFEDNFVPVKSKFKTVRNSARKTLLGVASALTGKKYNLKDTFIVATSGRCEFRNKGIDMFLDSMKHLSDLQVARPVVAFILVPAWAKEPRKDLMESLAGNETAQPLVEPYLTHWLNNPNEDPILGTIKYKGFANGSQSNVDVIYVPCYLNGNDGVFDKTYYQLLAGVDATVFPSYYEPWGYTPLESVAFGVPTITTSLSGFGQWVLSDCADSFEKSGVEVVERNDSNYSQAVCRISEAVSRLNNATAQALQEISAAASQTAEKAGWGNFICHYEKAFEIAFENRNNRIHQ